MVPRFLSRISALLLIAGLVAAFGGPARADPVDFFQDAGDWFLDIFGLDDGGSHGGSQTAVPDSGSSGYLPVPSSNDHTIPNDLPPGGDTMGGGGGGGSPSGGPPVIDGPTAPPVVPEPATVLLCLLGVGGLAAARKVRR